MGALEADSAGMARCATHGGEYKILFWREEVITPPPVLTAPLNNVACVNHSNVPARFVCGGCEAAICDLCSFPQTDGSRRCAACASERPAEVVSPGVISPISLPVQNQQCVQHPNVAAVQICRICGGAMCATCDFLLPGNVHVCPTCATRPNTPLSPKRKKMLIGSFALAAWCTLVMAGLMGGMFRGLGRDPQSQQASGSLLLLILLIPSIVGTALGFSLMDRRLPKTMAMWIAAIWNGLILGGFILLMIIGMIRKA